MSLPPRLPASRAWTRLLLEVVPEGVVGVDAAGRVVFINPAGLRLLAYEAADGLAGRRLHELIHSADSDEAYCAESDCKIQSAVAHGHHLDLDETRLRRADGSAFVAEYRSYPLRRTGRLEGSLVIFSDVGARRAAEEQLRQAAIVFNSTAQAIVITDSQSRIVRVNGAYTDITGYRPEEVLGRNPRLHQSERHDRAFYERMWESLNRSGQWQGEIWNRRKNGEIYPAWENISVVKDEHGRPSHYVALLSDITPIKEAEAQLSRLAYHDTLTGLPNRLLFEASLKQALERAKRHRHRVALLFLDLDRFKAVNDSLGHAAGDRLLQAIAGRLRESVRSEDLVARLGGDEFTVILDRIDSSDDAAYLARKLLDAVARPVDLLGETVVVRVSIGIALYPDDAAGAEDLLEAADAAMYRAKAGGRNTFAFHTHETTATALAHLSMERELERALDRDELDLYYQPQIELQSGRIVGLEALLRWRHPRRGLLPAADFIAIAEESGQIEPIGDWIMRQACAQAVAWAEQGLRAPRIAVNLSPRQLLHERVLAAAESALTEYGAGEAIRIGVELSERALQATPRRDDLLDRLHALGIRISLDSFGTGHASFELLKQLPIDTLKIDRIFLRDLPGDRGNAAIAGAVVSLAHGLGLRVIAEGVENEDQLALLRAQGCDEAQGYLLGEAVPAALISSRLEHRA